MEKTPSRIFHVSLVRLKSRRFYVKLVGNCLTHYHLIEADPLPEPEPAPDTPPIPGISDS